MKDLSIVIPAFNEASRIEKVLNSLKNFKGEVILVNDGSTDETVAIAKNLLPNLKIIDFPQNQGKGAAVKAGILASTKPYILITDADNSTDISQLDRFKPYLKDYDVIIGSRALDRSLVKTHQPWYKEILGRLGNLPIRLLLVKGIKDTQCGFKLFKASTKTIWEQVTLPDYSFDFEFLYLAQKNNLKIKEVPVEWNNDPSSKVRLKDYFKTLINIFKIKFKSYGKKGNI